MMKNKFGIFLLMIVAAFGALVLYNVYEGRDLNLGQNTETVFVTIAYDGPVEIEKESLVDRAIFKSGIESEGRIVFIEKTENNYRIKTSIPVTKSGPYMKFGSQPVKIGKPFILEGGEFYFEGYISLIEAGVDNEK
ncbi:MAG: hypothetical protein JJE29_07845 [Peptostreptococcaceae bacterium]|nr:hypothetical protein [Peptostreptococcaceae bacterium]